jgi:hypothetical protein
MATHDTNPMNFSRSDYFKRNSGVKESCLVPVWYVPLRKLEEITGIDKSFFTQVSRKREKVDIEPIWKPIVLEKKKEQSKSERRGVLGFWKLTFTDLLYFMILDSLRDFKSGFHRALSYFMVYHMMYIKFKNDEESFLDRVLKSGIEYKLLVITKKFIPDTNSKIYQYFKDSGFKQIHHFVVLKNGKLCANYLYLTGEHNTYVPSRNEDIEKCQLAYLEKCFNSVEKEVLLEINLGNLSRQLKARILNSGLLIEPD